MSTHNLQFHDKIRKFSEIIVFWRCRKNFIGIQKFVRISHGKRALVFEPLRFDCSFLFLHEIVWVLIRSKSA